MARRSTVRGSRSSTVSRKADSEGLIAGLGCAFVAFAAVVQLAFLALIAWGIFELVTWVTSK